MDLKEKLDLWVKITGVNPAEERKVWSININGNLDDWDVKKMNDRIMESLHYDETGIFAEVYLSIYLDTYISGKTISLKEAICNDELSGYLSEIRRLHLALHEKDSAGIIMKRMEKAMDFYNLEYGSLTSLDIMEIISSAKNCISKSLDLAQLNAGKFANGSFKVCRDIYMYHNISDVVLFAAKGSIDGVSMCHIRDRDYLEESYFAFIIKNGDNLYVLSDRPRHRHPNQKNMRRCPGRDMNNRIESNFFPYESLSGIDVSDMWNTGRYGLREKSGNLSNSFEKGLNRIKLGSLSSLTEIEAFWAVYMFSLIKEKFYDTHTTCCEISYAACMVKHPLLESHSKEELAVFAGMPVLELPLIKDPLAEELKYDRKPVLQYQYLIDRFRDKIDSSVFKFNLVKDMNGKLIGENGCDKYLPLDLYGYETKEKLEYDQKWIARYNYAVSVQEEADREYWDCRGQVINEVGGMIRANLREIVIMHLKGEITRNSISCGSGFDPVEPPEKVKFSSQAVFDTYYKNYHHTTYVFGGENAFRKDQFRCIFTGRKPGVVVTVFPRSVEDLELICSCTNSSIPSQLRHYMKDKKYTGNCILENLDPFDWKLHDPFNDMDFSAAICISYREFLNIQEEAGCIKDAFWEREKPGCYNEASGQVDKCCGSSRYSYKDGKRYTLKKCLKCKYYSER